MAKGFADLFLMEDRLDAAESQRYAQLLADLDGRLELRRLEHSRTPSPLRDEFLTWVDPIAHRLGISPAEKLWHLAARRQPVRSQQYVVCDGILCGNIAEDFRAKVGWTVFHHILFRWRQEDVGAWALRMGYWDAVKWAWEEANRLRVQELCTPVLETSTALDRFLQRARYGGRVLPRVVAGDAADLQPDERVLVRWAAAVPQQVLGVATAEWETGDRWFDTFTIADDRERCGRDVHARLLARTAELRGVNLDSYLSEFEGWTSETLGVRVSLDRSAPPIRKIVERLSVAGEALDHSIIGVLESFRLNNPLDDAEWEDEFCGRCTGEVLKEWFLEACLREDAQSSVEAAVAAEFLPTFERGAGSLLRLCDTASRYFGPVTA